MDDILRYARENTVDAYHQVGGNRFFGDPDAPRPRILFVGNSITIHADKPEIGWMGVWGMAASDEEHDYVHVTMKLLREVNPDVSFARVAIGDWERDFRNRDEVMKFRKDGRDWDADIVVLRMSENTPVEDLENCDYAEEVAWLMDYFNPTGRAKFVVTDGFWPNPKKDLAMYRAAQLRNARFVSLTDLGQRDEMKAIGQFWHKGVASHPNDAGMAAIAERLFTVLKDMI